MAMAMIAIFGYIVAFVQADRGTVLYNQYVAAYTDCFYHMLSNGVETNDCAAEPKIYGLLADHRQAYAFGEPFLNLAIALTIAILMSPALRSGSTWIVQKFFSVNGNGDAASNHA